MSKGKTDIMTVCEGPLNSVHNAGRLAILIACMLVPITAVAQKPVPGRNVLPQFRDDAPVEVIYFAGATEDDKAFIDGVRAEADRRGIRGFKRWRLERRLKQPAFVARVKSEVMQEVYWNNPVPFDEGLAQIDWSSIDWEALFEIVMQLINLFTNSFTEPQPVPSPPQANATLPINIQVSSIKYVRAN